MPRIIQLGPGYILHFYVAYKVVLSYPLIAIEYPDLPLPSPGFNEHTRWTGGVFPYPATGFYTLYTYYPNQKEVPNAITTPDGKFESECTAEEYQSQSVEKWTDYQNRLYKYVKEEKQRKEERRFE